jgi:hypothetical protein
MGEPFRGTNDGFRIENDMVAKLAPTVSGMREGIVFLRTISAQDTRHYG